MKRNLTPPELFAFHQELCDEARKLMTKKNADYTNSDKDADPNCFANFTRCEDMGICSTEQGFLVRMTDKLSRLSTFAQSGELRVKDESVRDTILDVINYAVLFMGYIHQGNGTDAPCAPDVVFINEDTLVSTSAGEI